MNFSLIIPASGSSSRMGIGKKKEFLPLASSLFPNEKASTVLSCVAEAFLLTAKENPEFNLSSIVVTYPEIDPDGKELKNTEKAFFASSKVKELAQQLNVKVDFVPGGQTRQLSIKNAMDFLCKSNPDFVAIHDGARPWIKPETIKSCLEIAFQKGSCAPIIPVVDTIKEIDPKTQTITQHLKRSCLGAIQTPQIFRFEKLFQANINALDDNFETTDDSQIWSEYSGEEMYYCEGDVSNIKITYKSDIIK